MRSALWNLMKWFLFRMDAERVHRATIALICVGSRLLGGRFLRYLSQTKPPLPRSSVAFTGSNSAALISAPLLPRVWGLEFSSRLGLAAGFDKDAEILTALPDLGFGFAEIGTVTPRAQPGNDRPRLIRDPSRSAIFNRMGFNGLGASIVAERLESSRPKLPYAFRIGVNIGKNKDTPNEEAASDYVRAAQPFEGLADYLVINVSSPNTPGLRALQTVEALRPIIEGVNQLITGWKSRPPLLLKLAPEVQQEDLRQLIEAGESWGINGWVLTNTLGGRVDLKTATGIQTVAGGWSGGPLTAKSRQSLLESSKITRNPIISVGGILSPEEAVLRRRSGASLVQIYTGWIFGGPVFPSEIARALAEFERV